MKHSQAHERPGCSRPESLAEGIKGHVLASRQAQHVAPMRRTRPVSSGPEQGQAMTCLPHVKGYVRADRMNELVC
jgi:hypothetical protein